LLKAVVSYTPIHIYEFGPFRVDARKLLLLREGNQVRMPAKALRFCCTARRGGTPRREGRVDAEGLAPDAVVEENNLTVNISALRRSLSERPGEH
jgi:hypothetical protein